MSDIQFKCPKCGHSLIVDAAGAGISVPCPECNESLIIPAPEDQHAARADNATAGVDAASAVSTAPDELPSDTPMAGDQVPKRSSAMRGAARVFWILFKWVAMAACLIGWLINVAVRWIVVLPTLKARLARRYRKIGAQAYRNKIDEEKGLEIREQLLAIDHDAQVSGAQPAEGHKSQSGLALFVARGMRRRRMKRLLTTLGKELVEGEAVSDSLSRHIRRATRTKEVIERIRSTRPKIAAAKNFVVGMAMVGVAAATFYYRGDIPRLAFISTGVAREAPQESDISTLAPSETKFDVAPIVEVLPTSIELSDTDILSEQELQQLLKSIGRHCQFYVARRADVEKWPNWVYSGSGAIRENAWEIYDIISFEPERWQAADPGVLVTGSISFERDGQMQMWIREKRKIPIEDKNGFRRNLTVYEPSPDADVQKYGRHMAAVRQKEQVIETSKQNMEQAEATANKEKEQAAENARRDEEARKARADAIEYAATVIPDAVRLPEVHLSPKLAARGFTITVHTPRHDELIRNVAKKDWAAVVRIVAGRLESRQDVDVAVKRLTGFKELNGGYESEPWNEKPVQWGDAEERVSWDETGKSWEVSIEISSPNFKFEHEYIDYPNRTYILVLKLPANPEKLVKIYRSELSIIIPYGNTTPGGGDVNMRWTKLAGSNGYLYRVPLGGSHVYFLEYPWVGNPRQGVLGSAYEKIRTAVLDLNQRMANGMIDEKGLKEAGVKLATGFYQFISEKVAPSY